MDNGGEGQVESLDESVDCENIAPVGPCCFIFRCFDCNNIAPLYALLIITLLSQVCTSSGCFESFDETASNGRECQDFEMPGLWKLQQDASYASPLKFLFTFKFHVDARRCQRYHRSCRQKQHSPDRREDCTCCPPAAAAAAAAAAV